MRKLILQALGCWPKVSYVKLSINVLYFSSIAIVSYEIGQSLGAVRAISKDLRALRKDKHDTSSSSTKNAKELNTESFANNKDGVQSDVSLRKNYAPRYKQV